MKKKFLLSFISCLVILTGCAKKMPSDSEVKQVILESIGKCDQVKILNFTRLNGVPNNDGRYTVSFKYDINISLPSNVKSTIESNSSILAELDSKIKQKKSEIEPVSIELKQLGNKMIEEPGSDTATAARERYFLLKNDEKYSQSEAAYKKMNEERFKLAHDTEIFVGESIMKSCPNLSRSAFSVIFSDLKAPNIPMNFTKNMEGEVSLVNTENGWKRSI